MRRIAPCRRWPAGARLRAVRRQRLPAERPGPYGGRTRRPSSRRMLPYVRITSYNVCYTKLLREKGKGFYVPFPENQEEAQALAEKFVPFFSNEKIEKIGQNIKYDLKILANYNIEIKGPFFDTMIAHYLINPDMRHNMDVLSETYLKYAPKPIETLIGIV